jgi:hypothetical protein
MEEMVITIFRVVALAALTGLLVVPPARAQDTPASAQDDS